MSKELEVNLNLKLLITKNLTPNQYLWLYIKFFNLEEIRSFFGISEEETQDLENKGFIKQEEGSEIYTLRTNAIELFQEDDLNTKFLEFYGAFPIKVPGRNGDYRVLRAKDHNSKLAQDIKTKYIKLIKKPGMHQIIMQGLLNQLKVQKNSLQYLQNIDTWINQRTWEKFIDVDTPIKIEERTKGI